MSKKITVALTGLGGYGNTYLDYFFKNDLLEDIELVAGIDPNPVSCNYLENLKDANIPIFSNLDDFYKEMKVDLMIVSTPIHLHEPMTKIAIANGSNVLCEKPLAATIDEAKSMLNAEQTSNGLQVAIGYQWSYAPAIIRLKQDILNGRFGKAKTLKTISLWPRAQSYYERASWAGKIKLGDQWIMDSPVANATAHYLHNMLYLLGKEEHLSVIPKNVTAEIYRAKNIENFDTSMLRCVTEDDAEILFYTTHSTQCTIGPMLDFEFEKGSILYASGSGDELIARFNDGTTENYGSPNSSSDSKMILTAEAIRNGTKFRCGIEAASAHLSIVNKIQKSKNEIPLFPKDLIIKTEIGEDDSLVHIKGLEEVMLQCYTKGILPSEHGGVKWAVAPETQLLDSI